jgi:hypothetical protein
MRAFTLCLLCMLLFLRSHCPAAMLLLGLVPLAPSHAASVTVPVGGSIQAAIDAASPGDAIHLGRGEYFENIRLKQGVALVGSGPQATTIRALLRGCVVLADGDNELRHLAIADGDPGVYASGVTQKFQYLSADEMEQRLRKGHDLFQ